MSKAIWGYLKEADLEVTWANLFPGELPPDGNLGLVSSKVLPGCQEKHQSSVVAWSGRRGAGAQGLSPWMRILLEERCLGKWVLAGSVGEDCFPS